MRMNRKKLQGIGVVFLAAAVAACGGGGGDTTTSATVVTKVTISSSATTLRVGQNLQLTASAFTAANSQIANPGTFVWTSQSSSVLTVDQSGKVAGVGVGATTVTATVGGIAGVGSLSVTPGVMAVKDTIFTIGIATFSPNVLGPIAKGTTVLFSLGADGVGHDVQFNGAQPGTPAYIPVQARVFVPVTFTTSGTFPYFCPTHPQMTGTVIVQ